MATRKKNADPQRQGRQKQGGNGVQPLQGAAPGAAPFALTMSTMLMVGNEHVVISAEDGDNVDFMAEFIDLA